MSALRWVHEPEVTDPVMIVAFEGWNDAGEAASGAADHLIDHWQAAPFASIDPESFYDFTSVRPRVELTETGARRLIWPTNELHHARVELEGATRDVIIFRGNEPQLRWRTFCDLIVDVADRFGATMVVTLGALLADVPHTRPTIVYGTSDSAELADQLDLSPSSYEGPTGIVGVLHSALTTKGLASASLWAAVPTYVPSAVSPKATLALTERLSTMIDLDIDTSDLESETSTYERQVTEFVEHDDDTAAYVTELEAQYDDGAEPSPEQLVQEVEQFLREQNN